MEIDDIFKDYTYESLMEEIRNRIQYCWNDCFKLNDVEEWLNNFQGKVYEKKHENILALMLLNSFIYLSHEEVLHLCRVIYYEYVHTIALENEIFEDIINRTTFYPIGNPSESSSLVMYFFRIANDIAKDKFRYYPEKADINNRVVFIDDISGSGSQASSYILDYLSKNPTDKKHISYLTLIGTQDASNVFSSLGINFKPACLLDNRMKLFSDDSYTLFNENQRTALINFVNGYQDEVNWHPLGFGNSELALGFYYNVPDNCLPIFWSEHNNWQSIFKRFHKKYHSNQKGDVFIDRDKFI